MQMKEVEAKTRMPRANIRYYEKQGLLEVPREEIRLHKDDKEKLNHMIGEH